MELIIDDLSKKFKDKEAVSHVSLKLTPGVWGLLGANGAGKTTLMRMLGGTLKPTGGRVLYDGISIQVLGEKYRDIFGYLPQEFGFYPEFTVRDYLEYMAVLKGLPKRRSKEKIEELLERMTLVDVRKKKIAKLSGGMKRRVGIAQALLNEPEVLILDEPTSGLDPANARILKDMILEQKKMGKTIILTTHNMHDAEELCDRVAFIVDGTIKAIDSPHALRKSGADTEVEYSFSENEKEIRNICTLSGLAHSQDFQSALKKGSLTSIHSKEQTLEDIFIALTGRGLQ